jgi:hypothetical protein
MASLPRLDVEAVYPSAGPNHGYALTMKTNPGTHTICLFGIDSGPGTSRQLGFRTVTVR